MRNKQILLSGRAAVTNAANVPADRYSFLHLSDAEPSLGIAQEDEFVLVYDTNSPGQRLWSKKLITAYQHANNAYESQNTTGIYANAAFLKANSAYESQNVTGTYANNAYLHANSAYQSQNTTGVYANSAFDHANAANLQANSAYESQNVTGTYANNAYLHANSAYESQNTTGVYANASFLKANSAYESQNVTGTYANNAYLHANAAFIKANSAYDSQNTTGIYANSAFDHANAAFLKANSAYESQNVTGTYANNAYLHSNSAYQSQNTTGEYANSAFLKANSAYESQNTTGVYANAAFLKANSAYESQNVTGTYANNAYLHANSAYESQNTTGVYANASFLKANSAYESQNVTGTYANNAYLHANSAYDSQNTTGVYANSAFLKANSAYESQNVTGTYANNAYAHANAAYNSQNTTGVYANSAYVRANNSLDANVGGTVTGTVNIAGDLAISGNLYISGNVTSLDAEALVIQDPILLLANNNVTDAVDMGFVAHYNTDPTRHTGLIRHYVDQTWYLFDNYIPHIQETNLLDLSNTSFRVATLNANLSANLVSVRGIEIGYYSNAAFLQANTAYASQNVTGTYANNAYLHANSAYESQNVTGTYANNAYVHANSSYQSQNTTGVYANSAFLKANSAYESQNVTGTYANNAYLHANSAYDSQNTTGIYANASFLQANSAYESQNVTGTYANNAYLHANSSYESQNVTGTYANNAYLHANSAYDSQNTTGIYANSAFLQANSAYESQNVTGTYANNAYLHANSAYGSQNTTGVYANAAFLHANSAYESQNVTGTYANNAYLHANSSYESQNVTGTYANNAYLHANSAYGSQNTTGVYANAAFLHANSAYGSQNTTGIYANASFLKVNAAYQHANSAYDSQNTTGLYANAAFEKANAAVFTITANTDQIYTNVATGNVRIGLANVNTNIGTFGGQEAIPVINVDGYGRITSIANTTITVPPGTYIFPNTNQLTANANSGNILIGLANVNNDIGTFGGTEAIPVFEVDGFGRIVSVSNTTITVPPGTYIFPNTNQLTANANSGNVLIGLYAIANNVGTFGSEFAVPTITVDTFGRVTDIVNTTISIPQGTYIVNSNLITSNSASGNVVLGLAESGVTPGTYGGAGQTPVITVDEYGRITFGANVESAVNTLSTIIRNTYTATSGQTGFNTTGTFTPGYADVYVNGIKLSPADYVANPAGSVNIVNPTLLDGDVVDIQTATTFIVDASSLYEKQTFVATAGQTSVNFSYTVGEISVYLNGLRLKSGDDYTAVNGTTIVFPIPLELDDIVEVEKISRSVIKVVNPYMGTRETFIASSNGQNIFTPVGGYRIGFVDIFLNGIKLNIGNDVVANNGTNFTIVSPPIEEDDVIEIVGSAAEFSFANALPITGGTIYGNLLLSGNVTSCSFINAVTFNATTKVNTISLVASTIDTNSANVTGNITANGANVATLYFNDGTQMTTAASGTGGGSGITWKIATANTTANSGEGILVNTLSANVHITLPASPELGNTVRIVDMTGNFGINNCIIERNGQVIMGLADRLVISTNNAGIGLVFSDATHGWRIIENP